MDLYIFSLPFSEFENNHLDSLYWKIASKIFVKNIYIYCMKNIRDTPSGGCIIYCVVFSDL